MTPGEDRSCSDAPAPGLGLGPLAAGGGQPGHANQWRWDIVEMLFCMHSPAFYEHNLTKLKADNWALHY